MSRNEDLYDLVWNRLQSSDVIGDILRFALFIESAVDDILLDYFAPPKRRRAFERLLLQRLSFFQKLEVFAGLPLARPLQSHKSLCSVFASTRRLRNHVAHSYGYRDDAIKKLASDQNIVRWLRGYPDSLHAEYPAIRKSLGALRHAKDFCVSTYMDEDIPW